jgi:hypothetical protein
MTTRKAIALAGLVLALAILSPASALAKAKGTDRPMKEVEGTVSGTVTLTPMAGAFEGDVTGVMSHLGEYTGHAEGIGAFTPQGTFEATGTTTVVADNGDKLIGTATFKTSPFTPTHPAHTTTHVTTLTGGTGRFADARGVLTAIYEVTPLIPFNPLTGTLVNNVEGPITGPISY